MLLETFISIANAIVALFLFSLMFRSKTGVLVRYGLGMTAIGLLLNSAIETHQSIHSSLLVSIFWGIKYTGITLVSIGLIKRYVTHRKEWRILC